MLHVLSESGNLSGLICIIEKDYVTGKRGSFNDSN
jgi:hypothetical protein